MAKKLLDKDEGIDLVLTGPRNDVIFDVWSVLHLVTGILLGWILPVPVAVLLMIAWEPFEIFVLSRIFARHGIQFGYETVRNSLADIGFDILGISLGAVGLLALAKPPFHF